MTNSFFLPGAIATLSLLTAAGHSWLGEARVFGPLYAQPHQGVLASRAIRDVTRAVWHLPSLAWVALGLALVLNQGAANLPLYAAAIAVFAVSGIGNLVSLRMPHPGGLMLLLAAGLTALQFSQSIR